jgi:hypothetical protein
MQGFLDLVIYSACMETGRLRRYLRRYTEAAKDEAHRFQFQHTFHGSFGFAIASPLVETLFPREAPPVSRRVVERITRGFLSVENARQQRDALKISEQYERGMNANMCYAAAKMVAQLETTRVEYAVNWSTRLDAPQDLVHLAPISLDSSTAPLLQQAGKHLEEMATVGTEDLGERDIHGTVKELVGPSEKDTGQRSIIIAPHGFEHDLRATLAEDDYRLACDAHRDRRPISIRGRLISKKKGPWTLLNARGVLVR